MSKEKLSYFYIVAGGILWGLIGVSVRLIASYGLKTPQIVVSRFFTVALASGAYIFFTDKNKFKIERKDIKYLFAFGFFCLFAYNTALAVTIQLTSLSVAAALLYTSPIWAMLLSAVMFKEKLTWKKGLAIALSFSGIGLISGLFFGEVGITPLSLLTGLLSGIGYGSYGIFAKILLKKYNSMTIMFYPFLFAAITGAFFCGFGEMAEIIITSPVLLVYIFGGSFICFVIPYALYTYSLNFVEASRAAVIVSIEPVSAAIFGFVFFHEPVTLVVIIGIFCILGAVFILNINDKRMRDNEKLTKAVY